MKSIKPFCNRRHVISLRYSVKQINPFRKRKKQTQERLLISHNNSVCQTKSDEKKALHRSTIWRNCSHPWITKNASFIKIQEKTLKGGLLLISPISAKPETDPAIQSKAIQSKRHWVTAHSEAWRTKTDCKNKEENERSSITYSVDAVNMKISAQSTPVKMVIQTHRVRLPSNRAKQEGSISVALSVLPEKGRLVTWVFDRVRSAGSFS